MRRKVIIFTLAAALAVPVMGSSCEESTEDLEDVAGENDPQYRQDMKKIKLGMTKADVREIAGRPRDRQVMKSQGYRAEFWYYGTWQITFSNGKVDSKNRY